MINNRFFCFFIQIFCNVRASNAMPSFAITVVLTYLTDYYLRLMAKRSTNYPASRISILQQKTKLAFNKSYFKFHKVITNSNKIEKLRQVVFS